MSERKEQEKKAAAPIEDLPGNSVPRRDAEAVKGGRPPGETEPPEDETGGAQP